MEAPSIVSRARTAFHSAAAKAERVFTDIKKSDFSTDRDCDKQLPKFEKPDSPRDEGESKSYHEVRNAKRRTEPIKVKQDWQEKLKNIRIGKRGVQEPERTDNLTMSFAIFDENLYLPSSRDVPQSKGLEGASLAEVSSASSIDIIPPAFVIKQLAIGVETAMNLKSTKDLLASSRDSSPVRERAGLSFSAMKSLVLREKEDKFASEFGADEKVMSLISSLHDPDIRRRTFSWKENCHWFGDKYKHYIFAKGYSRCSS